MPTQDKVLLLHKVEETLKSRMFANLLEEAVDEIQTTLDEFDIQHIAESDPGQDDLLQIFLTAKKVEGRSEKTIVRYQYIIERFMNFVGVTTREVTTHHIREYFRREQERGVSDSTINGVRTVLSAYFGWLEHEKLIRMNPVFNVAPIHCQKKIREAFSDVDMEKIKRVCDSKRDIAIINLLFCTGCRISEIVALNRDDIDFQSGECIVLGKGNKQRTVYINDVAALTLKEYLATRSDDDPALFVGQRGRLLSNGVRVMLWKLSEKSGVEKVHPHRFRRTLITTLLNRGMPIQDVAIIVGHDKLDTTMRYYHANKSRIKSLYYQHMV